MMLDRFVPNARWVSGRHLPSACLTLQSPPLHCPAGATLRDLIMPSTTTASPATAAATGSADAVGKDVVVALSKGQIQLYHSKSGIKVRFCPFCSLPIRICSIITCFTFAVFLFNSYHLEGTRASPMVPV